MYFVFHEIGLTPWKLSLTFNYEYLCEFFIKFKDQGQFWTLLAMRIPKLSLISMINDELRYSRLKARLNFQNIPNL